MRILLTGFEPFDGALVNPSEKIAALLDGTQIDRTRIVSALLPVDRRAGPQTLLAAVEQHHPDAVLCLGQASGRAVLSIERVAVNWLDYRIPDNSGELVTDEPILPGAPAAYFTTLPTRAIYTALYSAGIPAELSMSAGTYLCNQVLYLLLDHLARSAPSTMAGFLHLPALPEQAATAQRTIPSMALETALAGVRTALETIAARQPTTQ